MTILKAKPDCCQVLEWNEAIKNKKPDLAMRSGFTIK
jgi:hypothetical protein